MASLLARFACLFGKRPLRCAGGDGLWENRGQGKNKANTNPSAYVAYFMSGAWKRLREECVDTPTPFVDPRNAILQVFGPRLKRTRSWPTPMKPKLYTQYTFLNHLFERSPHACMLPPCTTAIVCDERIYLFSMSFVPPCVPHCSLTLAAGRGIQTASASAAILQRHSSVGEGSSYQRRRLHPRSMLLAVVLCPSLVATLPLASPET